MFTRRDLVRLIIPLIIEQVLAATVGIADTFMVSSVGEAAVSGVSLVDSINLLLLNVFAALSTGGSIVASQYLGREDQPSANAAAKQLLTVTTLVSFGLVAVCMPGSKFILHALFGSADAAVMGNAEVYFLLSALSYPFMAVYNACAALFRAQGNSKISMMAALVMNIVNISFNALFIYGLRLGAAGAALGSLIARGVSAAFLLAVLCHHNNRIYLEELKKPEWHPAMIKSILRIGVPNGLENSMFHIGKLMVAGLITTFGTVAIAANAVGNSVMTMSQMPGQAVSLAMVTVVGQCVGAGEFHQAKKYILGLVGAAHGMNLVLNLIVIAMLHPIVGLFGLSAATAEAAWQICLVCALGNILFWPMAFALPNGLRAANDVKFTMITSVVSMWVFRVIFSYILGRYLGLGLLGVWAAMIIDWVFRAAVFMTRLLRGRWMNRQLI